MTKRIKVRIDTGCVTEAYDAPPWEQAQKGRMLQRLRERQWRLTVYGVSEVVPPVKLLWPERPGKERRCIGWVCGKKVPANRMVCPWCGGWNGEREWRMQPLEFPATSIEVQMPQSRVKEILKEILGDR